MTTDEIQSDIHAYIEATFFGGNFVSKSSLGNVHQGNIS